MLNTLLTLSLLGAAIGVLSCRQTIYALLSLITVFLTSSLYFIFQGVNFVGLILIIVYIGAIAMLFLYMTMLINSPNDDAGDSSLLSDIVSICVIWLAVRGFQAVSTIKSDQDNIDWLNQLTIHSDINAIGLTLYSEYGLILIMIGLLLFIAMVISVDVASKSK